MRCVYSIGFPTLNLDGDQVYWEVGPGVPIGPKLEGIHMHEKAYRSYATYP
jgi:hypothetical protein